MPPLLLLSYLLLLTSLLLLASLCGVCVLFTLLLLALLLLMASMRLNMLCNTCGSKGIVKINQKVIAQLSKLRIQNFSQQNSYACVILSFSGKIFKTLKMYFV
jgi:hypothetical protein